MAKTSTVMPGKAAERAALLPYLPALDGLRAVAVLAVIGYHAGASWLPGGFLGVEIFFVISGYLITSLLLAEWRTAGRVNFKDFWLRRARRLLPAVFLLLLAVLAFSVLFLPGEVAGLRKDAAAAAGYATNWYLILSHKSYFESIGRPSLLRHLWSLAVEEQFYLLWPLLFAALVRWLRPSGALVATLLGAAASTALMMLLYNPDADPSRVYYGTDTRAAALLLGAALAFFWAPGRAYLPRLLGRGRAGSLVLDTLGLAGLGVLAWACVRINEYESFLYQGGFLVVSLATVAVIAASVHPQARLLSGLLGLAPLRWIGLRSYGIYLWHWPVFMVTRPQLDVPLSGWPLLVLQLAATGILVELSYRFVEMPIRRGALGRAWRAWHEARGAHRRWLDLRWAGGAIAGAVAFVMLGQSVVRAQPPAVPAYLSLQEVHITAAVDTPDPAPASAGPRLLAGPTLGHWQLPFGPAGRAMIAASAAFTVTSDLPGQATPVTPAAPASAGAAAEVLQAGDGALAQAEPAGPAADPEESGTENMRLQRLAARAGATATAYAGALLEPQPAGAASGEPAAVEAQPTAPSDAPVDATEAPGEAPAAAPEASATPAAPAAEPEAAPTPAAQPQGQGPASPTPSGERVTAIGDSVMIAAAPVMQAAIPNLDLDAKVGRQASSAIQLLLERRAAGQLGQVVVIHIGNNGTFTAKQFEDLMATLDGVRRVIIVNLKVPRTWEGPDNAVLTEGIKHYPNAVLLDWHTLGVEHPEYFWNDGIHLRPEGAQAYTDLIAAAIKAP